MAHLIDKDALVAEIERIKKEECPIDSYEGRCKLFWFERFHSFLDTLEVKEVNHTDVFIEKVKKLLNKKDDRDCYTIGYIKRHLEEIIKEVCL